MPVRIPGPKPRIENDPLEEFWERMRDAIIIAPFAWLIALIAGGSASDWDTLDEIQDNLIPALVKRMLGPLGRFIDLGHDDEIDSDLGDKLNPIRTAATGVNDLADNIRNAVTGGVAAGVGNIAEAFEAVSNLFGIADNAEKIAMAAQQQLQDITNETNTPGWSGYSWSTIFSGADGTPLPSTDWATTRIVIVGDDGHAGIINNSADGDHFCAVRDIHKFATDSQSASIVVGNKFSFSEDRWTSIRLRCDSDSPTQGAVCWVRPGNIRIGRFSGGTNTVWYTVSASIKPGDIVRFRCHGDNYYVLVNGKVVVSWTDAGASVSKGSGFRHAAFTQEYLNGAFFDQASFQVASWAMADWVPVGGAVTAPTWRLRRTTTTSVNRNTPLPAQTMSTMPTGFYNLDDVSEGVTVNTLGIGRIQVDTDGVYEISATSICAPHSSGTAPEGTWRGTPWVLYIDGNATVGPISSGDSVKVFLAAGQIVQPGFQSSYPATNNSDVDQEIQFLSGGPAATFMGMKVS